MARLMLMYMSMTNSYALAHIRANCSNIIARYNSELSEFRITFRQLSAKRREELAYYTNDPQDAIDTARSMQVFFNEGGNFK